MTDIQKMRKKAAKLTNPKPDELPSGKWRCRITVKGKLITEIDDDPEIAHAKVLARKAGIIAESKPVSKMTVGDAIDRYIASKDACLSPSTIKGYKKIRSNNLQDLMGINLHDLTQEAIQSSINKMAKGSSPKSIANAHGLLSAALTTYYPTLALHTTLPQKRKYEVSIPSEAEIVQLLEAAHDSVFELPLTLAIWFGLRASEIRGLTWDCIEGDYLHIKQAIVDGEDGPVLKGTKTYSGDRKLRIPPEIRELLDNQPHTDEYIVHLTANAMHHRLQVLCKNLGIPHYRFHDLRHVNASVMLAIGIPDKYAMQRMGHATNNMLKTVYQHTMDEKRADVDDSVDAYFSNLLAGHNTTKS